MSLIDSISYVILFCGGMFAFLGIPALLFVYIDRNLQKNQLIKQETQIPKKNVITLKYQSQNVVNGKMLIFKLTVFLIFVSSLLGILKLFGFSENIIIEIVKSIPKL